MTGTAEGQGVTTPVFAGKAVVGADIQIGKRIHQFVTPASVMGDDGTSLQMLAAVGFEARAPIALDSKRTEDVARWWQSS